MFSDPHDRAEPTQEHYHSAVNSAVLAMEQYLKAAYDAATMKATDDHEDVLWAIADHPELIRTIDSRQHLRVVSGDHGSAGAGAHGADGIYGQAANA
jgi:hypothetical protein